MRKYSTSSIVVKNVGRNHRKWLSESIAFVRNASAPSVPEVLPDAPTREPRIDPQPLPTAPPERKPDLDPFNPVWPEGRPAPPPKA